MTAEIPVKSWGNSSVLQLGEQRHEQQWIPDCGVLCCITRVYPFRRIPRRCAVAERQPAARFGEKDFAYFFIEAEDFHDNDPAFVGASWLLSSNEEALAMIVNDTDTDPDTGELIEPGPLGVCQR